MDHVASILPAVLRKRGLGKHADAALVAHTARSWLTVKLPEHAQELSVRSFKDGELIVACGHSIAAQECQALAHELKTYLTAELPHACVASVRLVRGQSDASRGA